MTNRDAKVCRFECQVYPDRRFASLPAFFHSSELLAPSQPGVNAFRREGRSREAIEAGERALSLAAQWSSDPPLSVRTGISAGAARYFVGDFRGAIEVLQSIGTFEADMADAELIVPYDAGSAIGEIHKVHVLSESYQGDGVHYRVRAPKAAIERIRAMLR